jgi:hypothetical protein
MREFRISGQKVLVAPGWQISYKLNQRTTLSMTVVDLQELDSIDEGDSVEVYNNSELIFSGIVYSKREYEGMREVVFYDLQVTDNSALADKRLIVGVAENMKAGDIVREKILPVLAEEGVTAGEIQDGVVISKAVFNYIYCNNALDYLKDITGFNWQIDKHRKLNFFSRETNISPFVLSDTVPHSGFEKTSNMENYRNRQYIRGSHGETAVQQKEKPTPKPDGQSRNFILRFPVAKKPTIYINNVQVPESQVGVNGIDQGKKWYFSYNSNTISQDNSQTPLSTTDVLEITYIGLRNIMMILENTSGISDRKAKESGTSGIYENMINESSIKSSAQALQYGQGILQKYGEINDKISFSTIIPGLEAGQLLRVVKPLFKIDDYFLIESVNISAFSQDEIEYQVTALDGASLGGWERFFKNIIDAGRDFAISEDEVIVTVQSFNETEMLTSQIEVKTFNVLYPSDNLYVSNSLYPNNIVSNMEVLYD